MLKLLHVGLVNNIYDITRKVSATLDTSSHLNKTITTARVTSETRSRYDTCNSTGCVCTFLQSDGKSSKTTTSSKPTIPTALSS
jgi:hypothetical protein